MVSDSTDKMGDVLAEGIRIPCIYRENEYHALIHAQSDKAAAVIEGKKSLEFYDYALMCGKSLFGFSTPISVAHFGMITSDGYNTVASPASYKCEIDWVIDNYDEKVKYSKAIFRFQELDYFLPSSSMIVKAEFDKSCEFNLEQDIVESVSIANLLGKSVTLNFIISAVASMGIKGKAQTTSRIEAEFDETDDVEFLRRIQQLISDMFAFICNRRNIDIGSVEIWGNGTRKVCQKKEIVEEKYVHRSKIRFIDKYMEIEDSEKKYTNIPFYSLFSNHFEEFVNNLASGKITMQNIHPSIKRRKLVDLQHSLHITAAFEYYARTFLPEIMADSRVEAYAEIEQLIEDYKKDKTGKKLETANSVIASLHSDHISLEDKIKKAYNGYKEWKSLKPILKDIYGENVDGYALAVRKWRNELAHEKREYNPDATTVNGIKMVESIIYCIVLRKSSYSDDEIKAIHEEILGKNRLVYDISSKD